MPTYRFRCIACDSVHEIHLTLENYKAVMPCPCGQGEMKRIFSSFGSKEGRTNSQKIHGATERRLESGKWSKEELNKRKKEAPPGSREADSNEYWLGNEFKTGKRKLSDF